MISAPVKITTMSGGKISAWLTAPLTVTAVTENDGTEVLRIEVSNSSGYELPSTGGPGTRLFTILGSILVCFAGVLLMRRRWRWS